MPWAKKEEGCVTVKQLLLTFTASSYEQRHRGNEITPRAAGKSQRHPHRKAERKRQWLL